MVSQINYSSIDPTFPIAGKDNDSQGFRDNFGYIKNGLQIAQGEITALQATGAKTSNDNNFNGNKISNAIFLNNSDYVFDGGRISADTTVSFASGPYQKYIIEGSLNLNFVFPIGNNKYMKMRLELIGNNTSYIVNFAGTGATIVTNNISNPVYIVSSLYPRFFDVWTDDAGITIYVYEVNNNDGYYDNGTVNGSDTFLYSSGTYQKCIVSGNTDITIGGFPPSGSAGRFRLEVYGDGNARTLTFEAQNSLPTPTAGIIKKSTRVVAPIVVSSSANPMILEFWSRDGGNTIFMDQLGVFT